MILIQTIMRWILFCSIRREMDTNELFNPIPIFDNVVGDIPGSANYQVYTRCIYPHLDTETADDQDVVASDRGKRKREDTVTQPELQEPTKLMIREKGEGSSFSHGSNQCRGAVGPKPPQPP